MFPFTTMVIGNKLAATHFSTHCLQSFPATKEAFHHLGVARHLVFSRGGTINNHVITTTNQIAAESSHKTAD